MPRLRVHDLAMSVDGYAAGPDQDLEHPPGVGGERWHERVAATRIGAADPDDGLLAREARRG